MAIFNVVLKFWMHPHKWQLMTRATFLWLAVEDYNNTKTIKRRPKKNNSKKGKKKIVGTKGDLVTIKEINKDLDELSLSECAQNLPKVVCKEAPK